MAEYSKLVYFAVTFLILGGAVAAILFIVNKISEFVTNTRQKLESKGYRVSHEGVAVQTQKRFNHEDYVDATQRGIVKALGASSYGKSDTDGSGSSSHKFQTPEPERTAKKSFNGLLHRKNGK